MPEHNPRIFLCHASEDKPKVIELYQKLKEAGYHPWLDKYDLLPGQNVPVQPFLDAQEKTFNELLRETNATIGVAITPPMTENPEFDRVKQTLVFQFPDLGKSWSHEYLYHPKEGEDGWSMSRPLVGSKCSCEGCDDE